MPLGTVLNQENTRWQPASVTHAALDTASFSESAGENVALGRTLSDTKSFSDTSAENVSFSRSLTDTSSLTDTASENVGLPLALSDSLSPSDSASRLIVLPRALSDTESFSDPTVKSNVSFSRTSADAASFTDTAVENVSFTRSLSDTESFSDTSTGQHGVLRLASDTQAFTDAVSRALSLARSSADSSTFSDFIVPPAVLMTTAVDSATFSEIPSVVLIPVPHFQRAYYSRWLPQPGSSGFTGDVWYAADTHLLYRAVDQNGQFLPGRSDDQNFTNVYLAGFKVQRLLRTELPPSAPVGTVLLTTDTLEAFAGTGNGLQQFVLDVRRALRGSDQVATVSRSTAPMIIYLLSVNE